jgi:hypothetical protein
MVILIGSLRLNRLEIGSKRWAISTSNRSLMLSGNSSDFSLASESRRGYQVYSKRFAVNCGGEVHVSCWGATTGDHIQS